MKLVEDLFYRLGVRELEHKFNVAAGIEAGNGSNAGRQIAVFGVDFVIDIGIESAEAELAGRIGDIGSNGLGFDIQQIDNARRHGIFAFVQHYAMHRA